MTDFQSDIRVLLSEIDSFFSDTLRLEKMSKKALLHKEKISDLIFKIRQQFPELLPKATEFIRSEDEFIPDLAARELRDVTKAGFLDKRRKKETLFQRGSYQRRYCVIQKGIFYYYIQPTDKKQAGAFSLKGYKFRKAPYLPEDGTKKDLSFELACPGKRSYQFLAEITQDFKEWKEAVDGDGQSNNMKNKAPAYVRDADDDDEYYIAVHSDDDITKPPEDDDGENYEFITTHTEEGNNGDTKHGNSDNKPPILPKTFPQSKKKSYQSSRAPIKPPLPPKHKPKDKTDDDDDYGYDDDDYTDPNDLEFDDEYDDVVSRKPDHTYRKSLDRGDSELYYDDASSSQQRTEVTSEIYQDAYSAYRK